MRLGEDVDTAALKQTLERRAKKLAGGIGGLEKKLSNQGYLEGADPSVVEQDRQRLEEQKQELALLEANVAGL